jgi:hypothetical protein
VSVLRLGPFEAIRRAFFEHQTNLTLPVQAPNPSIERTASSGLRPLPPAAHVKR